MVNIKRLHILKSLATAVILLLVLYCPNSFGMTQPDIMNQYNLTKPQLNYILKYKEFIEDRLDIRINETNISKPHFDELLVASYNAIAKNADYAILPEFILDIKRYKDSYINDKIGHFYEYKENFYLAEKLTKQSDSFDFKKNTCFGNTYNKSEVTRTTEKTFDVVTWLPHLWTLKGALIVKQKLMPSLSFSSSSCPILGLKKKKNRIRTYPELNRDFHDFFKAKFKTIAEMPAAVYATDIVNIFGDRVGVFKPEIVVLENGDEYWHYRMILGNYSNPQPQNIIIARSKRSADNIKIDFADEIESARFCWACRLIDYSFDATNVFSYIVTNKLIKYVLVLLGIGLLFWLLFKLMIELPKGKSLDGFVKESIVKLFLIISAVIFISNTNTTLFYYIARPIIFVSTTMGNAISGNKTTTDCEYFKRKESLKKNMVGFTQSNSKISAIIKDGKETSFLKDKDIDLKKELICSIYNVIDLNNSIIVLAKILNTNGSINKISISYTLMRFGAFFLTFLISLYLIEAIFNIGLGIVFTPFALITWTGIINKKYLKLEMKTVINIFVDSASIIFSMFISTFVYINMILVSFGGAGLSFKQILEQENYSAAILYNLLAYNKDFSLGIILLMVLAVYTMRAIKELMTGYTSSMFEGFGTSGLQTDGMKKQLDSYKDGLWKRAKSAAKDNKMYKDFKGGK